MRNFHNYGDDEGCMSDNPGRNNSHETGPQKPNIIAAYSHASFRATVVIVTDLRSYIFIISRS